MKRRIFIKNSEIEKLVNGKSVTRYMQKDKFEIKLIPAGYG